MWKRICGMLIGVGWIVWGCGGGGSSGLDEGFVFQSAGRLNLAAAVDTANPQAIDLTATLLDPNGVPIPNQQITFAAEFTDATIIPGQDNQGAAFTDNDGQARVTLIAGLTTGRMRVAAETPPGFNLSTALFVDITTRDF